MCSNTFLTVYERPSPVLMSAVKKFDMGLPSEWFDCTTSSHDITDVLSLFSRTKDNPYLFLCEVGSQEHKYITYRVCHQHSIELITNKWLPVAMFNTIPPVELLVIPGTSFTRITGCDPIEVPGFAEIIGDTVNATCYSRSFSLGRQIPFIYSCIPVPPRMFPFW